MLRMISKLPGCPVKSRSDHGTGRMPGMRPAPSYGAIITQRTLRI